MAVSSALSRGLSLLATFADASVWLSNSDIVRRTGLPAPTVARLTRSLVTMGMLHYSVNRRRFRLAPGVMRLGYGARCEAHLVEMARPHLQRFADRHHVHVSLAVLDETDALHLEVCHSASTFMTLRLGVGSRIPLACTAAGHAILSCLSEGERGGVMTSLQRRHERNWPRIEPAIARAMDDIDAHGFARCVGGWQSDINSVATPLRTPLHGGAMSIACGAPAGHVPVDRLTEIGGELVLLANLFSGGLQEGMAERRTSGRSA
ncbi:IclR family transcriptional regulator [Nitratireductor soli]|uniref:IclR family transcriptional regulator n=1 Tax=Nitratireductor soli TaxID=1670619 RepID=UPI00065E280E|nr:IclR family transcriptional regulator [Nitratireductor soli]